VKHSVQPLPPAFSGRDLERSELRAVAACVAGQPALWRHLVAPDPTRRTYEQLWSDEHLTIWLICWMTDHDTGFHDHERSCGAVAVVEGRVREERLVLGGPPRATSFAAPGVFDFGACDIHRVLHDGGGPAVTIHAYSPALTGMGSYSINPDGTLERRTVSEDEELRAEPALA
jgi:predicted metal-dependent enzyme (double-stranded beta helix superfamily)